MTHCRRLCGAYLHVVSASGIFGRLYDELHEMVYGFPPLSFRKAHSIVKRCGLFIPNVCSVHLHQFDNYIPGCRANSFERTMNHSVLRTTHIFKHPNIKHQNCQPAQMQNLFVHTFCIVMNRNVLRAIMYRAFHSICPFAAYQIEP